MLVKRRVIMEDASGAVAAGGLGIFAVVYVAIIALMIASVWKIFTKAGQPGWASLVPIYNIVVMFKIAGKPLWWLVLLLIPFANFVVLILVCVAIAKAFGKSTGFAVGMILLGIVFFPLLAFSDAKYTAPPTA
jgi:hypothetical protein